MFVLFHRFMAVFKGVVVAFVISFCSIPVLRSALKHNVVSQYLPMFILNYSLLITAAMFFFAALPPSFTCQHLSKRNEIYYMCCLFMCISLAGISFQTYRLNIFWKTSRKKVEFFKFDEPFVLTPFGMSSQIWTDIVSIVFYTLIIFLIDNCISYRNVALYWSGATLTNQLITLCSALTGNYSHKLQFSEVIRVIYTIAAIWVMFKLLVLKPRSIKDRIVHSELRVLDWILVLCLAFYIFYGFMRGIAALDCKQKLIANYVKHYEPYISHPSRFGATWVLHTAVYGIPLHLIFIKNLVKCAGGAWLIDTSVVYAASLLQGTFVYLTYSMYPSSERRYKFPAATLPVVLVLNVVLVLIAHILMIRCLKEPGYFLGPLKAVASPSGSKDRCT